MKHLWDPEANFALEMNHLWDPEANSSCESWAVQWHNGRKDIIEAKRKRQWSMSIGSSFQTESSAYVSLVPHWPYLRRHLSGATPPSWPESGVDRDLTAFIWPPMSWAHERPAPTISLPWPGIKLMACDLRGVTVHWSLPDFCMPANFWPLCILLWRMHFANETWPKAKRRRGESTEDTQDRPWRPSRPSLKRASEETPRFFRKIVTFDESHTMLLPSC